MNNRQDGSRASRKRLVALSLRIAAAVCVAGALPAAAHEPQGFGIVMTYNVNEGTDFQQVIGTTTLTQFLLGVGQIITQVQGTNPPERMQSVARQILRVRPELVSLQEVDQWSTGSVNPLTGTCGTMTLEYDMLQELLAALASKGGHYSRPHRD